MQVKKPKFYTNLMEERTNLGVSQEQLAEDLSVSVRTIRRIEKMENVPSVTLAMDISEYFGKTVNYMFWK